MAKDIDVLGIGNAIVDVIAQAEDDFVSSRGLPKGGMSLIDDGQAETLYSEMGPGLEMSGGSAANTIAGLAALGGSGAYIGKVHADELGKVFRHDIESLGVKFPTLPLTEGPSTARCLILVTPDAQRTMNTFLGACALLGEEDIDEEVVGNAKITYLEGYLFDRPEAKAAFRKAAKVAHATGGKVSLTLSDSFCVQRYRDEFVDLIQNDIDILFANESEITALFPGLSFDDAVDKVRGMVEVAAVTRSEKGSVLVSGNETVKVDAAKIDQVVDTTGAGDLYAAGVLYGLTHGKDLKAAGWLGSQCAAEAISHFGARPEADLADFLK